ncbi:hypothetical protein [Kitasatospora sp. SUK 42]|uniref:hypothetical protein n=1 Tax=Kitasatospora sp. SUK 42 TaxID=1588882 RepID=UPI0018CB8176|nr:hypothetical protein [Kitasatospora sp. SUK 42]MBV2153141.1 hypothetical protein [Kitasatospora sp. SUK 42]
MVTFSQLKQVDLGSLATAAGDFETLVRKWDLTRRMQSEVIGTIQQSGWHGDAAGLADAKLTWARDQIHAAFEEASALAKTLRDAHTEITAAKQDLTNAIHSATTAGLTVDDAGAVAWPAPKTEEDKRDPEYAKSWKTKAETAAKAISDAVDRATEADLDAAKALGDDTGSDATAFNANPVGGLPEEEAKTATYIMSLGDKATDAQLQHLQTILDHHNGDPRFASSFYGNQDPATFMAKYGAMAQSADYANSPARSAALDGIQKGLGLTLATATDTKQPLHVSDEWETKFRAAGAKQIPVPPGADPAHSPYGYQIMANLLRNGKYDAHFLVPVAQHITQLSQEDPMRWEPSTKTAYPYTALKFIGVPDKDGNIQGFNPLSAVLDGLGHNPEAATKFFHDPVDTYNPDGTVKSSGGANHYLDMFTDKGSRSILIDAMYPPRPNPGTANPHEVIDLGHALEAATLGRGSDTPDAPLPPHSKEMGEVMNAVIDRFGGENGAALLKGDSAPFNSLNPVLGDMMASYMGDIQHSISPTKIDLPSNGVPIKFDPANAKDLLATLGRNPEAFAAIATAQQAYTTAQIQDVIAHASDHGDLNAALKNVVTPGGQVAGIITSAKTDEIHTQHHQSDAAYNQAIDERAGWVKKGWELTGGKALGLVPVPGVSGVGNFAVDKLIEGVSASYKVDTTSQAQHQASNAAGSSMQQTSDSAANAVQQAAASAGFDPKLTKDIAPSAGDDAVNGFKTGIADYNFAMGNGS